MDLATTHINSDADGLGALLAARLLEPGLVLGLPGAFDDIVQALLADHAADLPEVLTQRQLERVLAEEVLGRLVVVDTARPERLGFLRDWIDRFAEVEAWDTHPAAPGDLPRPAVPSAGAATSVMIERLIAAGAVPSPAEAGVMLVAIHVDTGHFTFPSTTAVDHAAAAQCLRWGADPTWPARYAPRGFTAHQLHLLEEIAHGVEVVALGDARVAVAALERPTWEPDLSVLLGQLREAEGWTAAFLLAACEGKLWVIGRSDERVDVGAVLREVTGRGGGHAAAGSAVVEGASLPEARELVLASVRQAVESAVPVGAVAIRDFVRLDADAPLSQAADLLHRHRLNALPLVRGEADGLEVVGQVTRQEVDAALRHDLGERPAWEVSGARPPRVPPSLGLLAARKALLRGRGRVLVVGEAGRAPLGIVTRTTLLRAAAGEVAHAPHARPPHPRILVGLLRKGLGRTWPHVETLGRLAEALGFGLAMVGGAVRDLLLERPVHDVDLVVEGDAARLARAVEAQLGGKVVVHGAFGTAKWAPPDGTPTIDLASARAEVYAGRATLPEVVHAGLDQDLFRRDFTVNAMAVSVDPPGLGVLRDPYGGLADLRSGTLRVLHGLSFHDDPTRALRAVRFAARFDFRLAEDTHALIRAALRSGAFRTLGIERLGAELDRILSEPEAPVALRRLRDWGLASVVHDKLVIDGALLDRTRSVLDAVHEVRGLRGGDDPIAPHDALWMVLADGLPTAARPGLVRLVPRGGAGHRRFREGLDVVRKADKQLRGERRQGRAGTRLVKLDPVERAVLLGVGTGGTPAHVRWWEAEGRRIQAALDGRDLMAAGVPKGPGIGRGLAAAREVAWGGGDAAAQRAAALEAASV